MSSIIATDSCHRQQLKRATQRDILQPMVANSPKADFSKRLNDACDMATPPIVSGRGRRAELVRRLSVHGPKLSGESIRKWLSEESIPSMDNARKLATALNVNTDWLLTGRPPMRLPAAEQIDHVFPASLGIGELITRIQSMHLSQSDLEWLSGALDMLDRKSSEAITNTSGTPLVPNKPLRRPARKQQTGS